MGRVRDTLTLPLLLILFLIGFLIIASSSSSVASADDLSLVVSPNATIQVFPDVPVEKSPGANTKLLCKRVQIHGLSRLKHLNKYANSIKVKVSYTIPGIRSPNVEVCFHRNMTLGIGMCPLSQWEKLSKGLWIRSMSPFDNKLLDIRLTDSAAEPQALEVSLVEEFYFYRVVFLVMGIVLITLASFLSQSLVFYYSGAMAVGILLVILMVLFQGMRLLPTGRKSSLAIFVYSSIIGVGSFLLHYASRLLRSILAEIGIGEDMYNPLATFGVVFLVIVGAWLGFWVVRKLVLTEDGDIDVGVAHFVAWSIRIFASVMILQSSLDPLLAAEALLCGILISSILRKFGRHKSMHHLYRRLFRSGKNTYWEFQDACASPIQQSNIPNPFSMVWPTKIFPHASPVPGSRIATSPSGASRTNIQASTGKSGKELLDSETFYSTFHTTPERRKFTKDEWDKFTRESTKNAMEGLVSSPEFSKWAVAHADRITLAPKKDSNTKSVRQGTLFNWF